VHSSTSSIIWYCGQGAAIPCSWEGNCRSGVALAMHHRLQGLFPLWALGLDREMSTLPTLSCGVWPICLYLPIYVRGLSERHLLRHRVAVVTVSVCLRYGRVNFVLAQRLELLQEVSRLQTSLTGVTGDMSYTCETAGYFYIYQVRQ